MRTAYEAVRDYKDALQGVVSCFSRTTVAVDVKGGYYPADDPHILTINRGLPLPLAGNRTLALVARQTYHVIEDPRDRRSFCIVTAGYVYELMTQKQILILGYHWHPDTTPNLPFPHLHVRVLGSRTAGDGDTQPVLTARAHVPTGRIALEDVFRFVVREYAVEPARPDWEEVLKKTQAVFEELQPWVGA